MSASSGNTFPANTRLAFKELMELKSRFRSIEIAGLSVEEVKSEIAILEESERNVMLVWAEETRSINPGMVNEVLAGKCRYTGKIEDYLTRQCGD